METRLNHIIKMNPIANLIERPITSKEEFLSAQISNQDTSNEVVKILLYYLISEVFLLDDQPTIQSYKKQIEIAYKLRNIGLVNEASEVVKYVVTNVTKNNPHLKSWVAEKAMLFHNINDQIKHKFLSKLKKQTFSKITIQHAKPKVNGDVMVEFLDENDNAFVCKIEADTLYNHAENMVKESVSDTSDHTGEHIQRSFRRDVNMFLLNEMELVIKNFIEAGKADVKPCND